MDQADQAQEADTMTDNQSQPSTAHTPTPWHRACFQVYGPDKRRIAHTGMGQLPPSQSSESEANAAFIVEAVNNYAALRAKVDELTAALRDLIRKPVDLDDRPFSTPAATEGLYLKINGQQFSRAQALA